MTRRCSHCSNNGHNSRTCPTRSSTSTPAASSTSVRLFGVSMTKGVSPMKKSASMTCLSHCSSSSSVHRGSGGDEDSSPAADLIVDGGGGASGYASDDPNHASCSSSGCQGERKKGTPWNEEEHRRFLVGLQKLGKGDWRGIARNYVLTRTPTQVASHAQKYFVRQTNSSRRKRRSSLFDMITDVPLEEIPPVEERLLHVPAAEPESANTSPSLKLTFEEGSSAVEPITCEATTENDETAGDSNFPQIMPAFYPAYIPVPLAFWPSCSSSSMSVEDTEMGETHEILKPTPSTGSVHVDELVGISNLSIAEGNGNRIGPSPLSSKLLAASSTRKSAFHVSSAAASSGLNRGSINPIHAV